MPKSIKEKILFFIQKRKLRLRNIIIHHDSIVRNVTFKGEAKVEPYCRIIGEPAIVIGKNFYCNAGCHFLGNIEIGDHVMIGPKTIIWSRDHGIKKGKLITEQPRLSKKIIINSDVWIGAGVIILKGVEIGEGAVIGAGSIVTKDIPPYSIAAGNPARVIKSRE